MPEKPLKLKGALIKSPVRPELVEGLATIGLNQNSLKSCSRKLHWLALLLLFCSASLAAEERVAYMPAPEHSPSPAIHTAQPQAAPVLPVISIIIDDLGYQRRAGIRALELPGQLTFAILPERPYSLLLAQHAHRLNKEVMLHLPMEAQNGKALGPGGLTSDMSEQELKNQLRKSLAAVPHARGFNNHMGSLLTERDAMMRWLMQAAMFRNDLYFVDSRTSSASVALAHARKRGIAGTRRDIFLDYEEDPQVVEQQLAALLRQARRNGSALAIGHPYPDTLEVLEQWLARLSEHGVRLVPVSELILIRQGQEG